MNWTTEKPTKPGWYWVRDCTFPPHVFEIVEHTDGGVTQLYGKWINGHDQARMDVLAAFNPFCQFAGPIPAPGGTPAGWQPIATVPKNGDKILILFDSASVGVVRLCWWNDGSMEQNGGEPDAEAVGWWSAKHSVTQEQVDWMTPVAWMPMPECPRELLPEYLR